MEVIATTPFGRRPMTLGMLATQLDAGDVDPQRTVDKWKVFRALCEARTVIGVGDRALAVLSALLSFHPDTMLGAEQGLVVFPSNAQLSIRAHGMAPATLRRHLADLVGAGLVIRRDSPNGKRYARKGQGGAIEQAYGFDLSPIVARAQEFKDLAEAVRLEKRAIRAVKERLTICRRDIVKMIDAGIEEGVPVNWGRVQQTFRAIVGRLPRTAPRQVLEVMPASWRNFGRRFAMCWNPS